MSPIRLFNTLLLLAAVVGGALTYRAGRVRRELLTEQDRLEQLVGSLQIDDPTKMHVLALDTGQPLHFAWRIYFPAGFKSQWRSGSGGGSRSSGSQPREFVARVRFCESDDGILEVFSKEGGGSSRTRLGNRQLAELLHDRWDELDVEQLGRDQLVVVESNEIATLLRVTLSESLKQDAREKLWYDEHRWAIHLPEGEYRMKLATREVDKRGFPAAVKQTLLGGGEYRIELLQSQVEDCWKMTITVDDRPVIKLVEEPGWPPSHSSSGASPIANCTQMPPNEPIVLFRRRYMVPTGVGNSTQTPQGPTDGLMLWIELATEEQVGR